MSTIDQLKSLASAKLGFARSNQFLVELPGTFSSGGILGALTTLLTSSTLDFEIISAHEFIVE